MTEDLQRRRQSVLTELHNQGKGLAAANWKELLEELFTDIEAHLNAIDEEAEDE